MTRFRWLLATSLRGLMSRWVLSVGSLLLTVIAIGSAVVGPSYQQNAANSFVIAQLRAEPFINTGLTYDYAPEANQDIDHAVASAIAKTGEESGSGYLTGHPFVWQNLPQVSLPRLPSPVRPAPPLGPGCLRPRPPRRAVPHQPRRDRHPPLRRRELRREGRQQLQPVRRAEAVHRRRHLHRHRLRAGRRVLGRQPAPPVSARGDPAP